MLGHHRHGLESTFGASRGGSPQPGATRQTALAARGPGGPAAALGRPHDLYRQFDRRTAPGSGNTGDLPYVIDQANANTNTAGSEIEFDPSVFDSPQTITLSSTLALSETDGPEVIDGPGARP